MGEEGFSSDSSLLYHRGVPSAIVDSQVWELPDLAHHRRTTRSSRATSSCTTSRRRRPPGERPGDRAGGSCSATATSGSRYVVARPASPYYRNADRRRVRVRRGRARHRRDRVRRADLPRRRLRPHPARDHAPLGAGRASAALRDRGATATSRRRSATCRATASSSSTRRTASATCTGPTSRSSSRAPTSRCWSSTAATARRHRRHPADVRHAPVRRGRLGRLPLPLHVQRPRLRADHRPDAPAAAGAPGLRGPQLRGLQLRARARSTTTRCRSRCRTTTPTSTPTR